MSDTAIFEKPEKGNLKPENGEQTCAEETSGFKFQPSGLGKKPPGLDISKHPCFNRDAHNKFGRIHLPVAPRCNIQCNFCNRKFDCMNESRPGVTSGVLKPEQAVAYLAEVVAKRPEIAVMGIAGPGESTRRAGAAEGHQIARGAVASPGGASQGPQGRGAGRAGPG